MTKRLLAVKDLSDNTEQALQKVFTQTRLLSASPFKVKMLFKLQSGLIR